jgi:Zn finger protein HypA/HybF involved in hydrogenase expression
LSGTAQVEGLISYVCRLAEAHCVSPGVLHQQEILPSLRKVYIVGSKEVHRVRREEDIDTVFSLPKPLQNKNPNEQGFPSLQYIEDLQPLTLQANLQALTIPRWAEQTTQTGRRIEIARDLRAWCPECFQQWRSTDQLIYEPLLWSIAAVTVCPYHHQPLQSRCPHCHKTQRPITGRMQVARCSQCLKWLDALSDGDLEAEQQINSEIEWHLWVAERVMEVLAAMPNAPTLKTREMIASILFDQKRLQERTSEACVTKHIQCRLMEAFVH